MSTEAFRGTFHQKVDSKARVSIPADLRRKLNLEDPVTQDSPKTRIVMVYGGRRRNFVECYTVAGAAELAADIENMPLGSKDRLRAERDFIEDSQTVEIDDDGRIVLPPPVREKMGFGAADLDGGAMATFAAATNRFKLYRMDVWKAERVALEDDEDEDEDADPLARIAKYKTRG
jgi:MraZ protein